MISRVQCTGLFSDILYRPFLCANIPLHRFANGIPAANEISRISNLSQDEYSTTWINLPFILTEPVRKWPAFEAWTADSLTANFGHIEVQTEAVKWPLKTYLKYMRDNHDENPLYLFDSRFTGALRDLDHQCRSGELFTSPDCFGSDYFAVMEEQAPENTWLIMGPMGSGSTFHKDPNATNAWNAVLTGKKYWIMFPPDGGVDVPPGVIVSADGSEITAPISVAEYLISFHSVARASPGCHEGICHKGEMMHVPAGWFHLVVNLDEGVAVTRNFVPRQQLPHVLRFMRDKSEQVSGFNGVKDPYQLFVARLRNAYPKLLEKMMIEMETQGRWNRSKHFRLKRTDDPQNPTFRFNFS